MNKLPDEINITWGIDDVKQVDPDLTDDECREVLQNVLENHDATIGVTWDTLEAEAEEVRQARKQKEDN